MKSKFTEQEKSASLPSAAYFLELMDLVQSEKLTSRGAKDLLVTMIANKESAAEVSPITLATKGNLLQISDEATLLTMVKEVLENPNNAKSIADYKAGKEAALMALVGQVIRSSQGRANPSVTKSIFTRFLS
jgi:aspartyl-tRNA(Asn)/glutamyl-tRNA(Gln) amidotransferase subunit B